MARFHERLLRLTNIIGLGPFFGLTDRGFGEKRILPHLNYGDIVWGDRLGLKLEVDNIEAFQDRFAKR